MHQNDTTSFSNNGQQATQLSAGPERRTIGYSRCAHCERTDNDKQPSSCWCGTISSIIICILTLICIYLLYLVVFNHGSAATGFEPAISRQINIAKQQPGILKLVSVFSRHGDRAPAGDHLPRGDNMASKVAELWPRGLGNLTDSGRFRMFRMGLELRKRYSHHLDFNASHFLAFSSQKFRCKESLELTLRGLFQLDWTTSEGLVLAGEQARNASTNNHLIPDGSGSSLDYKQVAIDTQTVPSLSFGPKHFPCKYQKEHASFEWNYDPKSEATKSIREFKGVAGLEKILSDKYKTGVNFTLFDIIDVCGTVSCELQLRRTSATAALGRHYLDWINRRAPEYVHANVSLFDLCDQVSALFHDKCLESTSERLQLGPILTSLVTSQEAALRKHESERSGTPKNGITFDSRGLYASSEKGNKKMVLYSTHDSVIQPLLARLGIGRPIATGEEYEEKFVRWGHADSDTSKFLAGLGTSEFGISFVVELYEMPTPVNHSQTTSRHKSAYVQVALYNEEDPKYKPIEYRQLEFGRICRQLFEEQHPSASVELFFKQDLFPSPIDKTLSCPFELFKNVTSHYLISTPELNKFCAN